LVLLFKVALPSDRKKRNSWTDPMPIRQRHASGFARALAIALGERDAEGCRCYVPGTVMWLIIAMSVIRTIPGGLTGT